MIKKKLMKTKIQKKKIVLEIQQKQIQIKVKIRILQNLAIESQILLYQKK